MFCMKEFNVLKMEQKTNATGFFFSFAVLLKASTRNYMTKLSFQYQNYILILIDIFVLS